MKFIQNFGDFHRIQVLNLSYNKIKKLQNISDYQSL